MPSVRRRLAGKWRWRGFFAGIRGGGLDCNTECVQSAEAFTQRVIPLGENEPAISACLSRGFAIPVTLDAGEMAL